jgi:hypothetical protein
VRIFGGLFIVILLALAVAMYLQTKDVRSSFDAVKTIASDLREEGVEGGVFDRRLSEHMVASLEDMVAFPDRISDAVDDLKTISATAATWAQSAPSPSIELRVAVALRSAADELRSYGLRPSDRHLSNANRHLRKAQAALSGEQISNDPTGAVRDRLENLHRSHQEKELELAEELAE